VSIYEDQSEVQKLLTDEAKQLTDKGYSDRMINERLQIILQEIQNTGA